MKYDLVIATTTYFGTYEHVKDPTYRRRLWDLYVKSLRDAEVSRNGMKVHLLISDDGSAYPPDTSGLPFDATLWTHKEKLGWNQNNVLLLNTAAEYAPLCLIADSDSYFHPEFWNVIRRMQRDFDEASGWQLYRSPRLSEYDKQTDFHTGYVERSHASPFGLVYRTEDRASQSNIYDWFETFIGKLTEKHPEAFWVPCVSAIQHTGCYGLNNVPVGSEDFDPNFPFNEECGLGSKESFEKVQLNQFKETEHVRASTPDQGSTIANSNRPGTHGCSGSRGNARNG